MLMVLQDEDISKTNETLNLVQKLTKPQSMGVSPNMTEDALIQSYVDSI